MKKMIHFGFLTTIFLAALALPSFAQPLQKRIDFSISAPFSLRMGDYVLPSGNYVLRQVLQNDLNLFALYPEDLTNEPIALIRTARIDFQSGSYPDHTKIFIEMDEESSTNHPVIQGWTIPGMDGWEVISVVEKKSGVLTKYNGKGSKNKWDKAKLNWSKYGEKDRRSKIIFKKKDQ
ncbi:MAG TPA: hypothetical protein VFZ34_26850 [Blastocatellia bacterium]|nr:hypothetical protein [Blastocatellia bacterium]